jgi:hypothetical protein
MLLGLTERIISERMVSEYTESPNNHHPVSEWLIIMILNPPFYYEYMRNLFNSWIYMIL